MSENHSQSDIGNQSSDAGTGGISNPALATRQGNGAHVNFTFVVGNYIHRTGNEGNGQGVPMSLSVLQPHHFPGITINIPRHRVSENGRIVADNSGTSAQQSEITNDYGVNNTRNQNIEEQQPQLSTHGTNGNHRRASIYIGNFYHGQFSGPRFNGSGNGTRLDGQQIDTNLGNATDVINDPSDIQLGNSELQSNGQASDNGAPENQRTSSSHNLNGLSEANENTTAPNIQEVSGNGDDGTQPDNTIIE